ncbi:recombination protein RecR [Candidatus Saccharibacteria bacterium]|nr:recombination protein RecR [Candidatus Saccharibacteria bacterium]
MQILPDNITNLIDEFSKLPSVGPKSAERMVFYLLAHGDPEQFGQVMADLKKNLRKCSDCKNYATEDLCIICSSSARSKTMIAVVSNPMDIVALERTGLFKGTYHILHGVISPIDGVGPDDLEIQSLLDRVKLSQPEEILLATNPNIEGETTSIYISKKLHDNNYKGRITKLAHGLPIGADLEYADQLTLSRALDNRQAF